MGGLIAIGDTAIFVGGAFVFIAFVSQSFWLLLKDHLPYGAVITIHEWRSTVFWGVPLALGVALGMGKFLCFRSRSG